MSAKRGKRAIKINRAIEKALSAEELLYARLRATGMDPDSSYDLAFRPEDIPEEEKKKAIASLEHNPDIVAELHRIRESLKAEIVKEAPYAFKRLVQLAKGARSERVRLEANKDILDRAGFSEPIKIQAMSLFALMTPEQLKEILRMHMLDALGKIKRDGSKTSG